MIQKQHLHHIHNNNNTCTYPRFLSHLSYLEFTYLSVWDLVPFRFHHQALVELKILDVIKRKDKDNLHNVIHMKEYFYFRNHLCISFELLGLVYNKNNVWFDGKHFLHISCMHFTIILLMLSLRTVIKAFLKPLWF